MRPSKSSGRIICLGFSRNFIPLISVNFAETVAASDGKPQLRKSNILVQLGWEINLLKKVLIDDY